MSVISNNPNYTIVLYKRSLSTYGYGERILEVNNPKNIGWGDYLNDVPEAFFTLYQEDEQVEVIREWVGKAHIRIYRIDSATGERSVVWAGIFGTETNEAGSDVIFYSHGYLAALFWLCTDWNMVSTNVNLAAIVSFEWNRIKSLTGSEVGFVNTGTIEAPATTSGGSTPILLPVYTRFYKPMLNLLREMQAIARSDTTNVTVFEITHSETPTFNFWKNKGVDTNVVYTYGSLEVQDFWYAGLEGHRRNEVFGVGTSPRDLILRSNQSVGSFGLTGRRSVPIYFQWVRDQTELDRITRLRLARANRDHFKMGLIFYPGACVPPGMSYSPWKLADRVRVRINRGSTNVDQMMIVIGVQTLFQNGVERVTMIVETPTGS